MLRKVMGYQKMWKVPAKFFSCGSNFSGLNTHSCHMKGRFVFKIHVFVQCVLIRCESHLENHSLLYWSIKVPFNWGIRVKAQEPMCKPDHLQGGNLILIWAGWERERLSLPLCSKQQSFSTASNTWTFLCLNTEWNVLTGFRKNSSIIIED